MNKTLTPYEIRVIGCLIEKAISTPDQYPLSINALVNACNQKSNRDPVLELKESAVQETVEGLIKKYLVSCVHGSRVAKYQHRFCNSEFGVLQLSEKGTGILCELFLRGPQTPGELRTHTERLCSFDDVADVEHELERLMARDEPLVARLPREPGKRESRYAHLLGSSPLSTGLPVVEDDKNEMEASLTERVDALEKQVNDLQKCLDELRQKYESTAD